MVLPVIPPEAVKIDTNSTAAVFGGERVDCLDTEPRTIYGNAPATGARNLRHRKVDGVRNSETRLSVSNTDRRTLNMFAL